MRKMIDGKRYDTDQAELVYEWCNGHYESDFNYRSKALYRTASGAWFLRHEGGALTDMARRCGSNSYCGGDAIEAISDDDAYGFLEAHSDESQAVEAIEAHFAARVTDA